MNGSLAKRYAKALFEVTTDSFERDSIYKELERFTAALSVKDAEQGVDIASLASARHIPTDTRVSLVDGLGRRLLLSPKVQRFARILARRGRISGIAMVTRHFRDFVDAAARRIRVGLRSAAPLTPAQEERIRVALSSSTGQQVVLETQVDPTLIGGVVVHFKSLTVDRSVKRSLDEIRESFALS